MIRERDRTATHARSKDIGKVARALGPPRYNFLCITAI
jgi:hypothetical protein